MATNLETARAYIETWPSRKSGVETVRIESDLALIAAADLDKSLEMNPNQPIALFSRGVLFVNKGEKEKARADFEAVLKLTPDNKAAKDQLAALDKPGH